MFVIPSTWWSDVSIHENVKHKNWDLSGTIPNSKLAAKQKFKMVFENSIYYTLESANTQNLSTGDQSFS